MQLHRSYLVVYVTNYLLCLLLSVQMAREKPACPTLRVNPAPPVGTAMAHGLDSKPAFSVKVLRPTLWRYPV